jgi:hypothetical protein
MELGNRSNSDRGTMSQINVTPLVDVMLVLLVIFMVTAPMMQQGVQVNLPKAETKALPSPEESVVVSIEKSGKDFHQFLRNPGWRFAEQTERDVCFQNEKRGISKSRYGCSVWRGCQDNGRDQGGGN